MILKYKKNVVFYKIISIKTKFQARLALTYNIKIVFAMINLKNCVFKNTTKYQSVRKATIYTSFQLSVVVDFLKKTELCLNPTLLKINEKSVPLLWTNYVIII